MKTIIRLIAFLTVVGLALGGIAADYATEDRAFASSEDDSPFKDDDDTPEEIFCDDWEGHTLDNPPASPWITEASTWGSGESTALIKETVGTANQYLQLLSDGYSEVNVIWDNGSALSGEVLIFEFDVAFEDIDNWIMVTVQDTDGNIQLAMMMDNSTVLAMPDGFFPMKICGSVESGWNTIRMEANTNNERFSLYVNDVMGSCSNMLWADYKDTQNELSSITFFAGLWEMIIFNFFDAGGLVDNVCIQSRDAEPFEDPCGGACTSKTYNSCTCASDDPCLWKNDGVCDFDACIENVGTSFNDQSADCEMCNGYQGYSTCCRESDPCDLSGNDVCDCNGSCSWTVSDCNLFEVPQIVLQEKFHIDIPPVFWGLEFLSMNTWQRGFAFGYGFDQVEPIEEFPPEGDCARLTGNDTSEAQNEFLFSPEIDLTDFTLASLDFWSAGFAAFKSSNGTTITLEVSTDPESGAWTPIWTYPEPDWTDELTWYKKTIDLSEYDGQKIYLGWRYVWDATSDAHGAPYALDSVIVTAIENSQVDDDDSSDDDSDDDSGTDDDDEEKDSCCG